MIEVSPTNDGQRRNGRIEKVGSESHQLPELQIDSLASCSGMFYSLIQRW